MPGGGTQTYNGINVLDLPGGAGCSSVDGMGAYDELLWATPAARFGCAWDTGRAAVLQQPVKNSNLVARGTLRLGEHQVYAELTAAQVESAKRFSANQISSSTNSANPLFNLGYPSTGASYNFVFNELVKTFPQLEANRGKPLAFRWRCLPCGDREYATSAETSRLLLAADGPLIGSWDYRAGIAQSKADAGSVLGSGYFWGTEFATLISTGKLNPFLLPGQSQTAEALAGLAAISARGVKLYGGATELFQADFTASGPLFKLPSGADVMAAVGADLRTEKFRFNGAESDIATQNRVFNAAFDGVNTLNPVKRDVKALFAEVQIPVIKQLELTLAARHDDYSGFGGTTNPKVSLRFTPMEQLLFRGSYNTGFRVPNFSQLFFGVTRSQYVGKDLVDPGKCPTLLVDLTKPGCESITPDTLFGGKPDLGPEESKQWTGGVIWEPSKNFSIGADWWSIRKLGTIQSFGLTTLVANYALFPNSFIRDGANNLIAIDTRWVNAGETITKGVDIRATANGNVLAGKWSAVLDGTYLLEKKSRLLASSAFGASEIGRFTRSGELGIRWKHTLTGVYTQGPWTGAVAQIYRNGYLDAVLPGVANGSVVPPDWKRNVAAYSLFNLSVGYTGFKNLGLTFGIKNLFDKDPPFSATYDTDTGAGSSWEPRAADPRGRAFTFTVDYKFL